MRFGSIPDTIRTAMPTITLKNVPEELHRRLKERAARHHRSLNREAIHCLEEAVTDEQPPADDLLARIRQIREGLGMQRSLSVAEIEAAIEDGRP